MKILNMSKNILFLATLSSIFLAIKSKELLNLEETSDAKKILTSGLPSIFVVSKNGEFNQTQIEIFEDVYEKLERIVNIAKVWDN